MKGQRQQRIPPMSRKRQKFATGIAGGHARARASLLIWYAARLASAWTSSRPEDRAAQIAALELEQQAALGALSSEWAARRKVAFSRAKREVVSRRPAVGYNRRSMRPRRPNHYGRFNGRPQNRS
jgi:hypothetical protein